MPNPEDYPRRIYIAHPLRGDDSEEWGDKDRNFERYLDEVQAATLAGYAVVSWAHYELLHRRGLKKEGAFWLRLDRALIHGAEELWACGPPEVSKGTQEEIEEALLSCIPVRYKYAERDFQPCPFCGRQPTVQSVTGQNPIGVSCHINQQWGVEDVSGCPAKPFVVGVDIPDALKKWNRCE